MELSALKKFTEDPDLPEEDAEQLEVLMRALYVYLDRNPKYGSLWRDYPIADHFVHGKSKLARMERVLSLDVSAWRDYSSAAIKQLKTEDALDLINYVVFIIRKVLEEA